MGICAFRGETKKRKQCQDAEEDFKIKRLRRNSEIFCYQCYRPYLQGTRQSHIQSKEHIEWIKQDNAENVMIWGIKNMDKNDTEK